MSDPTPQPGPGPEQQPPPPPATPAPQGQQPQAGGGLDPKVGGLLAYLLFGWIGGLIMFLTQKDPEVRFHGAQSILYSIALFVVFVGFSILSVMFGFIGLGILSFLIWLVSLLVWLGAFGVWILLCIKGYNLDHFKLPLIGDMAEKWAAS